ncbi:hypothetical protein KI387_020178 [Taxus chinensis]|uniref:ENT domain-containing protein n=1 Tax=Taxus chinensis TaxID=29808 RepID=A0AA38LAU6_TAXCH|nr:hypothetical protein KI387_020178 [Taxus chinensis]
MEVRAGEEVEVSSDEDGFRGAWFSARVVKRVRRGRGNVLVEYRDLRSDKDETKALRETVELRHVRPIPPPSPTHHNYALYEEVDAYDNDGWWVGVVTKLLVNFNYLVYFMQTKEEIQFHHSQLRPHFDFIDDKWVQASKALLGVLSLEEDVDVDNDNGTIIPYIFFQNTETSKHPNPVLSIDKRVEDNISKPVRRSLRCTTTKRKLGTEGNLDNISPTDLKKVREEIVDLESPELSPQQNGKQESHQFSALPSFDGGVNGTLLHAHQKAINSNTSFLREKPEGLLGPKNTQKISVSHLNDVSTCKRIHEDTHGTGATDLETVGNLIGMKGKLKNCLKSNSSLHSSEATNTTVSETHNDEVSPNLNGVDMEPHIVSHDNISTCSLKTKKPNQNNLLIETYNPKGDGVIEVENKKSRIPSGSPSRGEKIFTITIPHLEYAGQSKADEGNSGSLHGTASLRELKLLAYHSVLQALYLQGAHNWKHEFLLTNLREALSVSNEEHSAELRRVTTANYD